MLCISLGCGSILIDFLIHCRTPEWLKKMFAAVTKSKRDRPVVRFFTDLVDAGIL